MVGLVISTLSCGGGTATEPPSAVGPSASSPDASPLAAVDAAPPLPPEPANVAAIAAPSTSVCSISGTSTEKLALRASPGAPVFANASAPEATVRILSTGGLFVEARTGGLTLTGYVDPDDAAVFHASHALAIGDAQTGLASGVLRVTSAADGKLTATLPTIADLAFTGSPPSAAVSCADLTLGRPSYDARASLPAIAPVGSVLQLRDVDVPFATTPAGPPVARLRHGAANVEVLDRRGAQQRALVYLDDRLLVGWIPSTAIHSLTQKEQETLVLTALGALSNSPQPPPAVHEDVLEQLQCHSPVRLVSDSPRAFAGSLAGDSVLRVLSKDAALERVSPAAPSRGGLVASTLLAPTRDLVSCVSVPITVDPAPASPTLIDVLGGNDVPLVELGQSTPGTLRNGLPPGAGPLPPPQPMVTGKATIGTLSMSAPLTNTDAVIRPFAARARSCYNKALKENPTLSGSVVVSIMVQPSGDVMAANVTSGGFQEINACLLAGARQLSFSPPGGSGSLVKVPITFSR